MATAPKIDRFEQHRDEYVMPKEPALLTIGSGKYLAVNGKGSPNAPEFERKVGALYGARTP